MKAHLLTPALLLVLGGCLSATRSGGQQNPTGLALPATAKVADKFAPMPLGDARLQGGMLGTRFDASEKRRLLLVDENDLLDCFERRNAPHQDWQGEHVGKF